MSNLLQASSPHEDYGEGGDRDSEWCPSEARRDPEREAEMN